MSHDDARAEVAALSSLGSKIGIAQMAIQDFDLVYAAPDSVAKFCDQFESIDLTPSERFYFMQLIVASLDEALRTPSPPTRALEKRVESLLSSRALEYEYIIDYWRRGGTDFEFCVTPMMRRLKDQLERTKDGA
jgi:hypothetical protein